MKHHFSRRDRKAHPFWHDEVCLSCQAPFVELSDPAASMHLCTTCLHMLWGIPNSDAPLQRPANADDWWADFVYQYERDLALGVIDKYGVELCQNLQLTLL
jgi:hypothetical protein